MPRVASGAEPTLTPYPGGGRHVFDYDNSMSAGARASAEALAIKLEGEGAGRVIVYHDDLMALPEESELAAAWQVDGLLLTGWSSMGSTTVGATLTAKLTPAIAKYLKNTSPGPDTFESWVTSTLARLDGTLNGATVFDGTGLLDANGKAHAAAVSKKLSDKIGAPVYIDIAFGDPGDPETTAFFNGADFSSDFGKSVVIALAVSGDQIGGYVDGDSDYWDSWQTDKPWSMDVLSNLPAQNGDVQAALLQAIDAVSTPPDPVEAASAVTADIWSALKRFFDDPVNQQFSLSGSLIALLSLVLFALDRRRRRREAGYGDDDSVMLPAPPDDMTPALAAIVAAPLNTTRAVTTALLDLAAHGYIAFYQTATPLGPNGGIKVISAASENGASATVHAPAADRPLGSAETSLLEGLRGATAIGRGIAGSDFTRLRPLFEQTGEQLERIAGERGWLRLQARSVSIVWLAAGIALLAGAIATAVLRQPIAALALAYAAQRILRRARSMPLPLRTPNGRMTSAMVDAYRRTLKRALAGDRGSIPPWLANAEEAALWGYAWGLEGEVQAFVAGNVASALHGLGGAGLDEANAESAGLRNLSIVLGGMSGRGMGRPVGLDTDAIANTLGGLGQAMERRG